MQQKKSRMKKLDNPKKILIRAVNWLGDAVMTTPAIGAVRETFPVSEITLLANPLVSQLFSPYDWVDKVITFDRNGRHKGVTGRIRLAQELKRHQFDAAIILPNSFDSALVPWLARIPVRLGKNSDGRYLFLTDRYSPDEKPPFCHEVLYYLNLMESFGIRSSRKPALHLSVTDDEIRAADVLLSQNKIMPDDFVLGINPGATFGSAKRWYPERFAEVAGKLAEKWQAKIIVFGGSGEAPLAAEIERRLEGGCLNLAGKTGIRELMTLIRRCNFFITNDSGPMHIAAAFGVPLVAVFGPTDHNGTSPFTDNAAIVRKNVECAPCKLRKCPTDHRCMTEITAGDVLNAAEILAARIYRNL